jgi:hypothetical protein
MGKLRYFDIALDRKRASAEDRREKQNPASLPDA